MLHTAAFDNRKKSRFFKSKIVKIMLFYAFIYFMHSFILCIHLFYDIIWEQNRAKSTGVGSWRPKPYKSSCAISILTMHLQNENKRTTERERPKKKKLCHLRTKIRIVRRYGVKKCLPGTLESAKFDRFPWIIPQRSLKQ